MGKTPFCGYSCPHARPLKDDVADDLTVTIVADLWWLEHSYSNRTTADGGSCLFGPGSSESRYDTDKWGSEIIWRLADFDGQ